LHATLHAITNDECKTNSYKNATQRKM